jgi:hypothetical protein
LRLDWAALQFLTLNIVFDAVGILVKLHIVLFTVNEDSMM